MMLKKNRILILLSSVFIIISLFYISSNIIFKQDKKNIIAKVLKSEAYAYLSSEAKDYVETVYEKSGTIILTEKNKVENIPYLNPKYVNYLSLDETEKKEVALIPEETIIDYVMPMKNKIVGDSNSEMPNTYDLRNVNGKNFVTPVKNQGALGLCWAFGTLAQAESYLLVNSDTSYSSFSQIFSERQLDYATANDGVIDGKTLYNFSRFLGDAGNFLYASSVMVDGLGLVDKTWKTYDDNDFNPMEFNKIYNYSNSKYEVEETLEMPILDLSTLDLNLAEDLALKNSYFNTLKETIITSGGLYVGTGDPSGYCSYSIDGNRFLYDDGICASAGHAMQIIGWDDNYEYSFCSGNKNDRGLYYIDPDTTSCANENIITGTGAWLVKNSWGNIYSTIYLAYDSFATDYNAITKMNTKNWDNSYGNSKDLSYYYNTVQKSFNKKSTGSEKINSIKIGIGNQNKTFKLYIGQDENSAVLVDTIISKQPGVYTFDLLDKNIIMTGSSFYIKISSSNGGLLSDSNSMIINTNNVHSNPQITTYDTTYTPYLSTDNFFKVRVESDVIDITENELINYKILDSEHNEIISSYTVTENIVSANKVFAKIIILGELQLGSYIIQSIYDGEVLCESELIIDRNYIITNGTGTQEDPYLITSGAQLDLIRTNIFAYYKLMSDIDLTYDTKDPNGMFYNNGLGWEPVRYKYSSSIGYSGGFDGNNHQIIGLYINRPTEDYVGLFSRLYNTNFANMYVKNLTIKNANVTGKNYVGILTGFSNGTTNERCLTLNNIDITNGQIQGYNYVGGISGKISIGTLLTGYCVETGKLRHEISNLYSNVTISANSYAGGIFGLTSTLDYKNSPGIISNLLSYSKVTANSNSSDLIGSVQLVENNPLSISNSISLGNSDYGIIGGFANANNEKLSLTNIYHLSNNGIVQNDNIITNNVAKKSRSEIKQTTNYSSWNGFSDNWSISTIDNILRYPMLKFVSFQNFSISDINIDLSTNSTIDLYSLITPNYKLAKNIDYEIEDTSIATINDDCLITGLKAGETTIHIISYYDGYEKDVPITVTEPTQYTITFNSNGGSSVNNIINYAGKEITSPTNPTRNGYTFEGWYTDNNTFDNAYNFSIMGNTSITLYAKWTKNTYSITYNTDGGNNISDGTTTYDITSTSITLPTNPTKEGFSFKGWKLITCESNWTINTIYNTTITLNNNYGNIILKAIWEEILEVTIDDYVVEGNYLKQVSEKTTKNNFISKFHYCEDCSLKVFKNNAEITDNNINIGTGTVARTYKNSSLLREYTVIIKGDNNGDGAINLKDATKIVKHYLGSTSLDITNAYGMGSDINSDSKINLRDASKIVNYYLGKGF